MIGCPPAGKWRQYLQDRLSPSEERALTEHVESCRACEAILTGLTAPRGPARARATGVSRLPPELVGRLGELWSATFPPDDLAAPERWPTLKGYEILGVLGRGGMGIVYRARQSDLGREVAIKMIAAGERSSAVDAGRLLNDASTAAQLRHDQIVPVYAVGQHRGLPYCVMELITGGSLAQRVADLVGEPREAARLVAAASQALHHAHRHGVCHRDVKPANILLRVRSLPPPASELSPNGIPAACRPRLCEVDACVSDFGLAKRTREEAGLTLDGELVGTPEYMAPEQIRSAKPAPAADVYGLGAVLYECLTGQPPSRGATRFDTLLLTLNEEPERPRRLNSRLPRDLETICLKCLEKEPQRRYPSAAALAADLERWLCGEPVRARPVGLVGRFWRWCRRKPRTAALLLTLVLTLVAGSGSILFLWLRAEAAHRESEEHVAMLRQVLTHNVQVRASAFDPTFAMDMLPEPTLLDAETVLSHLLQLRANDQELRILMADVLTCLGVYRRPKPESLAFFEQAARLWEQVPSAGQEPQHLVSRATTYIHLGQVYAEQGHLDLAVQACETSFRYWKQLAEEHHEPVYQDGLFYAAADLGFFLAQSGRSEEEAEQRVEYLGIRPELLGGNQGSKAVLAHLRVARLGMLAERHYQAKEQSAGLAAARQAATILDRHYEDASFDPRNGVRLARSAASVSSALRHGGAPREALRLMERVHRYLQQVVPSAREAPALFGELSASWEQIGKARWDLDQVEATLEAYRHALAAQQKACMLAPTARAYRQELAKRYLQLGRKLCELDRLDEAEACFRERELLFPGEAGRQEALRELQKWADQAGRVQSPEKRRERQCYLDLCARLETNAIRVLPVTGNAKP